ncbi:MAG: MBL fold metallo-hydrolase, partial [Planctomycetaceae bacterium]|nr:MBL fold metallo-hydrolase [Planctomycetaceae bacterium]
LLASIGVTAEELANMLYESIERLKQLPDETLVYPAHGAGSLCGKQLSQEKVSTIGDQKKYNYALQPMSRDEFIKMVEVDQPDAPGYFVFDAIKNRQERPSLQTSMEESVKALTLEEVLKLRGENAQILDVREAVDFEGAHLKGSLNIGLRGQYATWCGTLLTSDRPIVIIAEEGEEREAIMRLGRIGFDNVAGYLKEGMQALDGHPELIGQTTRITAEALAERLEVKYPSVVIDIRSNKERETGFIEGSLHIPLTQLKERLNEIPVERSLVLHCAGGYRSAAGCSLLAQNGIPAMDLVGGFKAWEASKLPVAHPVSV